MDADPVFAQALQPRDLVADFVVENLGAPTGDGVKAGITQARDGVVKRQVAVLGDRQNLRGGIAMQMNLRKALADATQHLLMPLDLEIRMQSTLHQNACAAEFDRLANLVVNRLEIEKVALLA